MNNFLAALAQRVLIFDGAMGTNIQRYQLTAEDYGGQATEGCNEYLVLTKPSVIEEIHAGFLEVGCDIIETDSFTASRLKLDEYGLGHLTHEINFAAAQLARRVADRYSTPQQPRFVAGSVGPHGARSIIRLSAVPRPNLDIVYILRYHSHRNTTCRSKHLNRGVPRLSRRQAFPSQRPGSRRSTILSSACLWKDPRPDG